MRQGEHQLVLSLFANQFQSLMGLVALLKSRGVVDADDLEAYESFLVSREENTKEIIKAVWPSG